MSNHEESEVSFGIGTNNDLEGILQELLGNDEDGQLAELLQEFENTQNAVQEKLEAVEGKIKQLPEDKAAEMTELYFNADPDTILDVLTNTTCDEIKSMNEDEFKDFIISTTIKKVVSKDEILRKLEKDIAERLQDDIDGYTPPDDYNIFAREENVTFLDGESLEKIKSDIRNGSITSLNIIATPEYLKIDNHFCLGVWYEWETDTILYEVTKETLEELYLLKHGL